MFQFITSVGVVRRHVSSLVPVHAGAHKRMYLTGLVSAGVRKVLFVCTCTVGAVTGDDVSHRDTCRQGCGVALECV